MYVEKVHAKPLVQPHKTQKLRTLLLEVDGETRNQDKTTRSSTAPGRSVPEASFNYFLKMRVGSNTEFQALPDKSLRFFNPLYIRIISVITDKYPL